MLKHRVFAIKFASLYPMYVKKVTSKGRTQAELDEVRAAIRAIVTKGFKSYTIGSRRFDAADLGQLMQRESQLKSIVAREQAAEKVAAGLGDPRSLFVRFGR